MQSRRVYEILKLRTIDRRNAQVYREYRLIVKNRLNGPYKVSSIVILYSINFVAQAITFL